MNSPLGQYDPARMCHNCGFPIGHRYHDGQHSTGCPAKPKPEGLYDAVLAPAMWAAAEALGIDHGDAFLAAYDHFHRNDR